MKHEQLVNADYGFKFRAAHSKYLFEAMQQSLEKIINMTQDDSDDEQQKNQSQKKATEGDFFQMKRRKLSENEDMLTGRINPIDEDLCGEDFHNPMYDAKMVHPLGRFNQTFALFRATYIDVGTLGLLKS